VVLAVLGLVVGGAVAAVFFYRIPIAERLAREVLADTPVGPVAVRIDALENDHAIIADLEIPAFGTTARRVRIDYSVGELFDRHVRRLHVQDLSVQMNTEEGLTAPPAAGGPGDRPKWTVGALVLEGAQLAVESPHVLSNLSIDADIRHQGGPRYEAAADVKGEVTPVGKDAVPVAGRATFRGTLDAPEAITVDAVFTAPPVPLLDIREARITGRFSDGKLALRADIALPGGRLDVSFEGPLPAKPDLAQLTGLVTLNAQNPPLPFLRVRTAESKAILGADSISVSGTLSAEEGTVAIGVDAARPKALAELPPLIQADIGFQLAGVKVPQAPGPVDAAGRVQIGIDGTAADVRVLEDVRTAVEVDGRKIATTVVAAETRVVRTENIFDVDAPLQVRVDDATIKASGETLSLFGVDAEVRPGPVPAMFLRAARLDANRPGIAPTIDVDGRATLEGELVRFDGHVRAVDGVVAAAINGRHDLGTSAGMAKVSLGRLDFIPGLLQPGDLSGAFPSSVTDVSGGVSAKGSVSWSSSDVTSDLVVGLHGIGFVAGGAVVEGITGSVAVDRPWPPRTPPGQTLVIRRIVAGLPMTDGALRFRLDDAGRLHVVNADFSILGGRVALSDLIFDADAERQTATVRIKDVGVQNLIDFAELDGTSGTGVLDGTLPVSLSDRGISVSGGRLTTLSPGVLSYDPPVPPAALQGGGEGVSLMLEALKNFHYDVLGVDIDGEAGGEWIAALHLTGNNPDFMDGYPFELNFNLSGKLDAILRDGMAGFSLPERIGEGLSESRP